MEPTGEENQLIEIKSPGTEKEPEAVQPTEVQAKPVEEGGEKRILREMSREDKGWGKAVLLAGMIVLIVGAGALTGYFLARKKGVAPGSQGLGSGLEIGLGQKEAGVKDEALFPDKARGKIEVNDFSQVKEGSHKLLRSGGEGQTAYLTSSVIDLNEFVGRCVEVWGETFAGQEAGWLMDVGFLEVIDQCPEGV
jgi:hypothetical protein